MSYQQERDRFVARMTQEGLPLEVTRALLRAATTLQRYAELACSSEAADRDRVACPGGQGKTRNRPDLCLCDDYPAGTHTKGQHSDVPRITVQADRLERRLAERFNQVNAERYPATADGEARRLAAGLWELDTQEDPRGYVLRVIPPSYAERNAGKDRFNRDVIGVPSGPTRLKF